MWSADCDSQDKNLVGSLDLFGKTATSRGSVESILTHVYPSYYGYYGPYMLSPFFKTTLIIRPHILVTKCNFVHYWTLFEDHL